MSACEPQVPQMSFSGPSVNSYTELSTDSAGQMSDLMKAVNSIPAYVERSSHFLAITPTVKSSATLHLGEDGVSAVREDDIF